MLLTRASSSSGKNVSAATTSEEADQSGEQNSCACKSDATCIFYSL